MKELIKKIEGEIDSLNTLLFILNNGMKGLDNYKERMVKEEIDLFSNCTGNIKSVMNEIAKKFGDVKLKDL